MLSYVDFHRCFLRLHAAYSSFHSLEDALSVYPGIPEVVCFSGSLCCPQKKLNMFLRWMIRRGSEVDFGTWKSFYCTDLIVLLDTHVCRVGIYTLQLTDTATFSLKKARRITEALAEIFPEDPCLGDFVLFGDGINNPQREST